MKPRRIRVRLAAVGLGSALVCAGGPYLSSRAAGPDSTRTAGAPVIYQKSRSFRVPFHFDPSERAQRREIQLWVSEDSGRTWSHKGTTTPEKPALAFRAEHDGEFWLAVRTLDAQGHLHPSDSERVDPSMKVVVDTVPPAVVLEPRVRSASLASVHWEIRDEFPDLSTSVLEYQVEGTNEWRPVPERRPERLGVATWDAGDSRPLKVRAKVVDRAGNATETILNVPSGRVEALTLAENRAAAAPEATTAPLVEDRDASPSDRGAARPSDGLPSLPPPEAETTASDPPVAAMPPTLPSGEVESPKLAAKLPPGGLGEELLPPGSGPLPPPADGPPPASSEPPPASSELPPAGPPLTPLPGDAPGAQVPERMPRQDAAVPNGSQTASAASPPLAGDGSPAPAASPPGVDPGVGPAGMTRITTDTSSTAKTGSPEIPKLRVPGPRFTLDYAVDDAGPNGPAIVELWVTRDGGKSWKKYGKDADRVSPIQVDLSRDGTYGLSLIARDEKGLGDKPPVSGDAPQMWVEVPAPLGRPAGLLQRAFRR